eukprot:CAMPEP_0174945430 /NCGR_PEP_ID=MMETSP1355-20121228/81648_1 /TAXON_ID=464990 /ORGANISM="Hemiselmis tepida, Strain CCMP443" /LENGTH=37 /DNA_ID= /DNA_START= /DNA_END= /DNA_ORIENTATION=
MTTSGSAASKVFSKERARVRESSSCSGTGGGKTIASA